MICICGVAIFYPRSLKKRRLADLRICNWTSTTRERCTPSPDANDQRHIPSIGSPRQPVALPEPGGCLWGTGLQMGFLVQTSNQQNPFNEVLSILNRVPKIVHSEADLPTNLFVDRKQFRSSGSVQLLHMGDPPTEMRREIWKLVSILTLWSVLRAVVENRFQAVIVLP